MNVEGLYLDRHLMNSFEGGVQDAGDALEAMVAQDTVDGCDLREVAESVMYEVGRLVRAAEAVDDHHRHLL